MNDPLALLILNRTTGRYAPDSTVEYTGSEQVGVSSWLFMVIHGYSWLFMVGLRQTATLATNQNGPCIFQPTEIYGIRDVRSPNFEIPVQFPEIKSFGF